VSQLTSGDTATFYDLWSELFLSAVGPVLQAGIVPTGDPPREDPEQSVLELAVRAGLQDGDRVLDAGCGVGGPAIIVASHYRSVTIEGVTISRRQTDIGRRLVAQAGVADRVQIQTADYQRLPFRAGQFDQVLFLESTGYATDLEAAYNEAFRVLRPGGRLYVKDVFCRSGELDEGEAEEMKAFDALWSCTRSKTLTESVDAISAAGFEVEFSSPLQVGTDRLLGSMFEPAPGGGFQLTPLGDAFWRKDLDPPIVFGEIRAVAPR
jgi:SAM-dependent methyltransferase